MWQGVVNWDRQRSNQKLRDQQQQNQPPPGVGRYPCAVDRRFIWYGGVFDVDNKAGKGADQRLCVFHARQLGYDDNRIEQGLRHVLMSAGWNNEQIQQAIHNALSETSPAPETTAFNLKHHKQAQFGNLLDLFIHDGDDPEEAMQCFFECLEDDKRSIIDKHKGDVRIVLKIKEDEKRDIDNTSKDLAMEG